MRLEECFADFASIGEGNIGFAARIFGEGKFRDGNVWWSHSRRVIGDKRSQIASRVSCGWGLIWNPALRLIEVGGIEAVGSLTSVVKNLLGTIRVRHRWSKT